MKKFNLFALLLPLLALTGCEQYSDYYKITFHTTSGDVVKYYPYGSYPTPDGYISSSDYYYMSDSEKGKYSPSLQPVTQNAEYIYLDYKVTFENIRDSSGNLIQSSSSYINGDASIRYEGDGSSYYYDGWSYYYFEGWYEYTEDWIYISFIHCSSPFDTVYLESATQNIILSARYTYTY